MMGNEFLYALDFDGVICDSALETGLAGWKAAGKIWPNLDQKNPPEGLIERFKQVRPAMETGFESILLIKMLIDGEHPEVLLGDFVNKKIKIMEYEDLDEEQLKVIFGQTRDDWVKTDLAQWIQMNPLYQDVVEKIKKLAEAQNCYVVTTKQERFVKQILTANKIQLDESRIYGMEKKMSKENILKRLIQQYPDKTILFLEDRLPALLAVKENGYLESILLNLADWGYNTEKDKRDAREAGINVISQNDFIAL